MHLHYLSSSWMPLQRKVHFSSPLGEDRPVRLNRALFLKHLPILVDADARTVVSAQRGCWRRLTNCCSNSLIFQSRIPALNSRQTWDSVLLQLVTTWNQDFDAT